ncbi:D-glycero-beta-D-manno-heptose 1-phosphate adenylyltransferase [Bacteroidales bacterium OttesenSCG-928-K03]|nr:D-glycero-beta-D-manno-heptose 1-phosphate adenylyltransferase [Odoribacter sp. OttesenSCG-928-L07]MDL2239360.1 D-glycero-beta-D-manno-heptose 1-phosphate adenylyltransferase [Bacteroidales bacterium OttesenSCG-928-L14]MDL2240575.1 D-glycero-beta-D-manno-heptose 1-phosphate adenylyltransferase [Bacteroidales bacterium OttesenSCG-928-K22]MDL2242364.1 D-glycero-beta-D-manno-heptose 1-phosphate adenylyltransferase [Bacteroidales bacterium OttesenSCG-928-K03]
MKNRKPQRKIVNATELPQDVKIVFTNGCFDILHAGHVDYLFNAAQLGDVLVVGLNTDNSVKRLKGENRPINKENDRATLLASLYFVDYVVLFNEDTPLELIKKIKPHVLVKGGDYKVEDIVGADFVKKSGGEVIILPFKDGYSSSSIISKF